MAANHKDGTITLYHGTVWEFVNPRADANREPCDFGNGFYLTEDYKRAFDRALETAAEFYNDRVRVMKFCFDIGTAINQGAKIIYFDKDERWMDFVRLNRKGEDNKMEYDIAIGPSADGALATIIKKIDSNQNISIEEIRDLVLQLSNNHFGEQYCFHSQKSIDTYLSSCGVDIVGGIMDLNPESVREYVIGAFSEAHGIPVSTTRRIFEKYSLDRHIEKNYRLYAYRMPQGMVRASREYIVREGGTVPPIVNNSVWLGDL